MAVQVVVLTGGPRGGRSTFMVRAREWLEKNGYSVLTVAETAMEMIRAGASPSELGPKEFQEHLLRYSLLREGSYREMAQGMEPKKVVIIFDRGVVDCATYMGDVLYRAMLLELSYSPFDLMHRYDYVLHLVTAARGAEESYVLAAASERSGMSPEEARTIDANAAGAWSTHNRYCVVDNSTDFERKMFRALCALSNWLGIPAPPTTKSGESADEA